MRARMHEQREIPRPSLRWSRQRPIKRGGTDPEPAPMPELNQVTTTQGDPDADTGSIP